jgi:hypothetical protein
MNNRSDFFATMVQAEACLIQGEMSQGYETALAALELGEGLKSARCALYVMEFQGRITAGMKKSVEFRDFAERARGYRLWGRAA